MICKKKLSVSCRVSSPY